MARLKIVDEAKAETFYQDLNRGLAGRDELIIGHNTRLVRHSDGSITVRLYATDVVRVEPNNSVDFQTGGYLTVTTLERINRVSRKFGIRARAVRLGKSGRRVFCLEGIGE